MNEENKSVSKRNTSHKQTSNEVDREVIYSSTFEEELENHHLPSPDKGQDNQDEFSSFSFSGSIPLLSGDGDTDIVHENNGPNAAEVKYPPLKPTNLMQVVESTQSRSKDTRRELPLSNLGVTVSRSTSSLQNHQLETENSNMIEGASSIGDDKPIPVSLANSKRHIRQVNDPFNDTTEKTTEKTSVVPVLKLSESSSFDWGSLNDSELIMAARRLSQGEITHQNGDVNAEEAHDDVKKNTSFAHEGDLSFDWGSLNDNELVTTINKLSQLYKDHNHDVTSHSNEVSNAALQSHVDENGVSIVKYAQDNEENRPPQTDSTLAQANTDPSFAFVGDNYGEEENESHDLTTGTELEFGDYTSYFQNKKLNQQKLDKEYIEFIQKTNPNKSYLTIFQNCSIYVNGKTTPDITTLHKLVILNGGKFVHYLQSKSSVSHIIAENLTPRKRLEFRNYKVVRPSWIVDSITKGKLEHWADHMLINNDYGQVKLNFKSREANPVDSMDDNPIIEESDAEHGSQDPITVAHSQGDHYQEDDNDDDQNEDNVVMPLTQPDEDEFENSQHEESKQESLMDAKHPDFLKYFFAKSRLHHLSSWKADLRLRFLKMALSKLNETTGKQTKRMGKIPASDNRRVIVHVDFDCFFASVSARFNNPPYDINAVPLCVTHGGPNSDVSSCNYKARAKGVKNGTWLRTAKRLCPDLICLGYNFDKYEEISQAFYQIILDLKVDSVLPVSVDEALLDITSLIGSGEFSNEIEVMRFIKDEVWNRTRCSVSCGCGPNVLMAKLSLRKAKPDGVFSVLNYSQSEVMQFLSVLNFKSLPGIGSAIYDKLAKDLKLTEDINLSVVQNLPKEKLIQLLGTKTGTTIYDQVRGFDSTSIDILSNPEEFTRKSVSVDVNWGIRFDNKKQVEDFLGRLAVEVHLRMVKLQVNSKQMTLKLAKRHPTAPITPPKFMGMGFCDFFSKTSRLGVPTRDIGLLKTELRSLWRHFGFDACELRGVSVTMSRLVDDEMKNKVNGETNQMKLDFTRGKNGERGNVVKDIKIEYSRFQKNERGYQAKTTTRQPIDVFNLLKMTTNNTNNNDNGNSSTSTAPGGQLNIDDIDWSIFNELPKDIQDELRSELESRQSISTVTTFKRSPMRKNKSPRKLTPLPLDQHVLNFEVSPTKKRKLLISSPSKELSPIKANDNDGDSPWKKRKGSPMKNEQAKAATTPPPPPPQLLFKFNDEINMAWCESHSRLPNFQNIKDPHILNQRLDQWIKFTLSTGGPHDLDLRLFEDYLLDLFNMDEFIKVCNLLRLLKTCYGKYKVLFRDQREQDEGLAAWCQIICDLERRFKRDMDYDDLLMRF